MLHSVRGFHLEESLRGDDFEADWLEDKAYECDHCGLEYDVRFVFLLTGIIKWSVLCKEIVDVDWVGDEENHGEEMHKAEDDWFEFH